MIVARETVIPKKQRINCSERKGEISSDIAHRTATPVQNRVKTEGNFPFTIES